MAVAVTALVLAMAGTGYAATSLPSKSVGAKQLKANSVTTAKVKAHAITGKKLKLSSIGTVPKAKHAVVAESANALTAPQLHLIGAAGEPPFLNGATNYPTEGAPYSYVSTGFFKDHNGVVHLEGVVKSGSGPIVYILPPGFRPASGKVLIFPENGVEIIGSNVVLEGKDVSGVVAVLSGGGSTTSGITFRAES